MYFAKKHKLMHISSRKRISQWTNPFKVSKITIIHDAALVYEADKDDSQTIQM